MVCTRMASINGNRNASPPASIENQRLFFTSPSDYFLRLKNAATGINVMEFLYCFANASLTQRVLDYLLRKMRSHIRCVTVIFLNDRWVMRLKLDLDTEPQRCNDCWAFLSENGIPYHPLEAITLAFKDLDAGCTLTQVMNHNHVAIVSHGMPNPEEIGYFQEQFVGGLGYCPQSLV